MTIISRDCVGGVLYNQYGLKFLSPTINLYFSPEAFNVFCLNLSEYINSNLVQGPNEKKYPVGVLIPKNPCLKPIKVFFAHYTSFEEAKEKWDKRKERINYKNIYIVSTFCNPIEVENFNKKIVEDFNKINYKKVILVDKSYGFDNEFIIKKPKKAPDHGWLLYNYNKLLLWKKVFNKFNFNAFFNKK